MTSVQHVVWKHGVSILLLASTCFALAGSAPLASAQTPTPPASAGDASPTTDTPASAVRTLRVTVRDQRTQAPLAARLYLTSEAGVAYYFDSTASAGTAVRYEKQNWIDAESVEYHTTASAHPVAAQLPPGKYTLLVERGKTYHPHRQEVELVDRDRELVVELRGWFDAAARGWYSGDTHLHRTLDELRTVVLAEDLNVALPLTQWVTLSGTRPAAGDKTIDDARQSSLIQVDPLHVIWPRNTEYEIFRVGDRAHTLGALFVLGHRSSLEHTVPPWKPVIDAVERHEPGAVLDMDKLDWPFAMLLPTLAPDALYELANNHVWRTKFAFRQWNSPTPAYLQPPWGAAGGGHRQWLDYTHGMYHTLLNCGLRMPPSAGTANGVHPVPAGFGRVYVHLPDGFEYAAWMEGLRRGRSFVTTGPMLLATADGQDPGAVFSWNSSAPQALPVQAEVLSGEPLLYGELLINGRPEHLLRPQNERGADGAYRTVIEHTIAPTRSGWFAIRFWESQADGQVRFAHTAPWYVEVDGQPVQLPAQEKAYLVQRMQAELIRSNGILSAEAMQELRDGLEFYQRLPVLDEEAAVARQARPETDPRRRDAWLDNMIVHHRFTADEVRLATGLDAAQAESEVRQRAGRIEPAEQARVAAGQVLLLPYPGGRHPRRGFLDGAIDPQRETKISLFPPWTDGGYVVVDVPEAVFSNLGLTYLAHTHVPTIWDAHPGGLAQLEWQPSGSGLQVRRELPNGIRLESDVTGTRDGAEMELRLHNGTPQPLSGLRVQVCTMLSAAIGFNAQEPLETIVQPPWVAIRARGTNRWIITGWTPNHRVWTNPPVPCIHSDPVFPDCAPGQTVTVRGQLRFYEGAQPPLDRPF
jgi:hypothetical protein